MDHNSSTDVEVQHPDVSYEHRDLSYRAVFVFLVILGSAAFVIYLFLFGVFRSLGKTEFVPYQSTNPIMTSNDELREIGGDPAVSFPMPRLQPNPVADLNRFRLIEEEELNTYGWVDQSAGRIHMPIEQAIDILGKSWPSDGSGSIPGLDVPNTSAQENGAAGNNASGTH